MTKNEMLKSRLLAIFCRKGTAGSSTKPFDEVDESTKRTLLGVLALKPGELPVLAILRQPGQAVVITTQRVIWLDDEKPDELLVENIGVVEPAQSMALVKKQNLNCLKLRTFAGGERFVETEPGPPFWGAWNLIGHFATLNHRQHRTP